MFELARIYRLDTNLVDLILKNLTLLNKNNEKYFPPYDVFSVDWVRVPFVLSAFESGK
jgi:hypothetical protein